MEKQVRLSESLTIPRLVIGLWQIADMERKKGPLDPVDTARYMEPYARAGLTAFDMADHYGSSEIIAGTFKNSLADPASVSLFTKWVPEPGKISKKDVRKAVEKALTRMQQPVIDLMQFHAWHYPDPSWLDALMYLNELREEGLFRNIGVTNFDAAHLRVALSSGIPLVTNQVSHSVLDRRAQGPMRELCATHNVKLLAYGTLAGGFLTDKWLGVPEPRPEQLTTWSEMKYKRFIDAAGGWALFQELLRALREVADKHQSSIAAIASRYVLETPSVAAVIIGARLGESAHIDAHSELLEIDLDAADLARIASAQEQLKPIPGDCGDEYRKPPFLTASGDLSHHLKRIPRAFSPVQGPAESSRVFSGTPWEAFAGYARAVRKGNAILVSGTTATHGELLVGGSDPAAQTHFVIDKIEAAVEALGGTLEDVVRTRVYVNHLDDWEAVAKAHGERFRGIDPANTLVEARLVGDGYLVEIEAEALLTS
ncbi:aldo/keto reductase [Robiginitalea sp. SC105]|uniref:aldo/keto reductase n=1 Tax=Robiginitalea sp. SC105 TaxID=2762332 RepID=UPI001639EA55|nr:aldo/keto reductase [Robiginitalea sp. SC105]MBC2838449.1 aldo/keto reductase [Robiginitalea sp. SC105]